MDLLSDLMPLIENRFGSSPKPELPAMAGASMGCVQALIIGLANMNEFQSVVSFSGLAGLVGDASVLIGFVVGTQTLTVR